VLRSVSLVRTVAACLGFVLPACGAAEDLSELCDAGIDAPESPAAEPYDERATERSRCAYDGGEHTAATIGPSVPTDVRNQIGHVVVLMLENRSYDHLLGAFERGDGKTTASNPDALSAAHSIHQYPESRYCMDSPDHEWSDAHLQFDNGAMDGFVAASNPGGGRAMGYYREQDVPFLYWLARNYSLSDRHFCSLLGPTWPNWLFLFAGTSCGYAEGSETNLNVTLLCGTQVRSIFHLLDEAPGERFPDGRRYEVYNQSGLASVAVGTGIYPRVPVSLERFESDAESDALPAVSFVGANTGVIGESNDDHPPANIQLGQRSLYRIVSALRRNARTYERTVLFVTYDENGGFFDHVVPPSACDPARDGHLHDYEFNRYGFRVPMIIVSPHVRAGYVTHFITDHSSIIRFVEHWLDLPALTSRDANAWPFLDVFDFDHAVEADLPDAAIVDLAATGVAQCQSQPKGARGVPDDYVP
jgi:phospholipase C